MSDDDQNQSESDSDSSSSSSDASSNGDNEPAPAGDGSESVDGSEPPPAGDETEPAPDGESSGSDEQPEQPLEDNEGHSDSAAERNTSEDSSSSESNDTSSSSSSGSDSGDSSSGEKSVQPPSADDVGSCIMHACNAHDVPMDDDTVNTTLDDGLYKFAIRLGRNFNPLPQVHDDTQSLQAGSVEGAGYLLQGAVQVIGNTVRITARIVSVETSEILQAASADGSSDSSIEDAITGAAGDALAGLPLLNAT